jgi:hypothetical protein
MRHGDMTMRILEATPDPACIPSSGELPPPIKPQANNGIDGLGKNPPGPPSDKEMLAIGGEQGVTPPDVKSKKTVEREPALAKQPLGKVSEVALATCNNLRNMPTTLEEARISR